MLDSTDPNALIIETARRFAQERLAPSAGEREKAGRIEPEIIKALGEMGFLGATNSAEWGGSEIPYEAYAQVVEEIAAGDGSVSTLVSVHNAPTCEILEKFGTPVDPFGWQADRRHERALLREYEAEIRAILPALRPDTLGKATELARLPVEIRGYGPVKAAALEAARPRREALLERIRAPRMEMPVAAE